METNFLGQVAPPPDTVHGPSPAVLTVQGIFGGQQPVTLLWSVKPNRCFEGAGRRSRGQGKLIRFEAKMWRNFSEGSIAYFVGIRYGQNEAVL